jgi:hypothetical protein
MTNRQQQVSLRLVNVDLIFAAPLILISIAGGRRAGRRPAWARRTDTIAIPATVLLILAGWVILVLSGTNGAWVMRLAYLPIAVMAYTSWVRVNRR